MAITYGKNYGRPTLDLNFAENKSLIDSVTGRNLITFSRSQSGKEATYVGSDGLIKYAGADEPRFDHDPVTGECLGLLIEESRTNLLTNSADLTSSAGWGNVSVSSMADSTVSVTAPDGSGTVTQLTAGGSNSWWAKSFNASTSTKYQVSMWVKVADGGSDFTAQLIFYAPGAGTVSGTTWNITSSWQRVTAYVTSISDFTGSFLRYTVIKLDNTRSFYAWGIQTEVGEFPTSYIPTDGTPGGKTRPADEATITGSNFSSWYNQNEGTFFSSAKQEIVYGNSVIGIGAGSGSIYQFGNTLAEWWNGSDLLSGINAGSGGWTTGAKIAAAYTPSNRYACFNSGLVASNTSSLPNGGKLEIGRQYNTTGAKRVTISRLTYWPKRLPDIELQQLTK